MRVTKPGTVGRFAVLTHLPAKRATLSFPCLTLGQANPAACGR